jgi:hypothetical protein
MKNRLKWKGKNEIIEVLEETKRRKHLRSKRPFLPCHELQRLKERLIH